MSKMVSQSGRSQPWAFMKRFEIPNLDNPTETYLTRWRIIQTPYGSLYLHRMDGPDSRDTLHDHPWAFLSIILRGSYFEQRLNLRTRRKELKFHRFFNLMRRDDAHYIQEILRYPTWTFLFVGRRRRTWGYWRQEMEKNPLSVHGFVRSDHWTWTEFSKDRHQVELDRAMEIRNDILERP